MKQNERILVYVVTGFLAVILVVAVLFGRDSPSEKPSGSGAPGLMQVLDQKAPAEAGKAADGKVGGANPAGAAGLPAPEKVTTEQPLAAPSKSTIAADMVAQQIGPSRRERTVRWVRVRAGDSLEVLVRRWCGARDPFLDEAKSLNEELTTLHPGQEVAVPWVEDEAVLAAFEARQPKKLVAEAAGAPVGGAPAPAVAEGTAAPGAPVARPSFQLPGTGDMGAGSPEAGSPGASSPGASNPGNPVPAAATQSYTVKPGDSLWKIAEKRFGRKNADRMVQEIRKLNPGRTDTLRPDQKLLLPVEPAAAPAAGT
ncbi:MAG: LysM peptidoglycan-binding domain-containing protein [Planctomycetes bacterium]|nr:LysM peptidoglycan-binding domain-containing protein [Planctomycetota bacterium]